MVRISLAHVLLVPLLAVGAPLKPQEYVIKGTDNLRPGALAFSMDSSLLAVGDGMYYPQVRLFSLAKGSPTLVETLREPKDKVEALAFSPDSKWLAVGSTERNGTRIYKLGADGKPSLWTSFTECIPVFGCGSEGLAFSSDSKLLVSGGQDWHVYVYSLGVEGWSRKYDFLGPRPQNGAVAFNARSTLLAVAGDDVVQIFDIEAVSAGAPQLQYNLSDARGVGWGGVVSDVAWSHDGRWLAVPAWDKKVRVFTFGVDDAPKLMYILAGAGKECETAAFSPNSLWLAVGSWDGYTRVYGMQDGVAPDLKHTLGNLSTISEQREVNKVAFSPDSKWLAMATMDNNVYLYSGFSASGSASVHSSEATPVVV